MTYPVFASGDVLNASDMNAVGLWLVKSQAVGSGVSSVTVTGAFSADYDTYKIIYSGGVGSVSGNGANISLQLGSSSTGYFMGLPYVIYGLGTAAGTSLSNAAAWSLVGTANTASAGLNVELANPYLAQDTRLYGLYVGQTEAGSYSGIHKVSTSYTAFTLTASSGTLTGGTIRVYGYRN